MSRHSTEAIGFAVRLFHCRQDKLSKKEMSEVQEHQVFGYIPERERPELLNQKIEKLMAQNYARTLFYFQKHFTNEFNSDR